ncbi:histone-like nucleoid-structuring protein Lsr2 [Streptomyces sp. 8L]|uniref:histone-like nucleoid-structuring protein Lsr2 n=1 Tax=Streptomyces sp. 8L TaxID=2877242 RepID=UPI001CD4C70B|nr:Lsr2 family protein [Streptomyces sp. 8L]MCA1223263.1 Lsr2 family protein [Streptomyces sp. 8L]
MARIEMVSLVDDLDGSEAIETIPFSIEGVDYLIELNRKNSAEMRNMPRWYIKAGRLITSTPRHPALNCHTEAWNIRKWAWRNGISIGTRGRIPEQIKDLYVDSSGLSTG